ncbi:MAG: DUF4430 domain-containing protein [Firmicutes bacterium]|nr:DUF4430 domain-containing protein [[Eubacterium] siraeum]MCM1488236.1 DUF4430 domain-containing protein [Bacillota bacterium]
MKQTKILAAVLMSALVLTLAAGCGSGGEADNTAAPNAAVTEADTTVSEADETVTEAPTEAATEAPAEAAAEPEGNQANADDLWAAAIYTEDAELGEGAIAIQVEVQAGDKSVTITVHTDRDNLGAALTDNDLVEGDESEYGLYIKVVNGIKADYDVDQSWWGIYKNGEMTPTGADTTMIADGEHYELVYCK